MKKKVKCYIYTRVSTSMQIDGYLLEAQKTKMKAFSDHGRQDAESHGRQMEWRLLRQYDFVNNRWGVL